MTYRGVHKHRVQLIRTIEVVKNSYGLANIVRTFTEIHRKEVRYFDFRLYKLNSIIDYTIRYLLLHFDFFCDLELFPEDSTKHDLWKNLQNFISSFMICFMSSFLSTS